MFSQIFKDKEFTDKDFLIKNKIEKILNSNNLIVLKRKNYYLFGDNEKNMIIIGDDKTMISGFGPMLPNQPRYRKGVLKMISRKYVKNLLRIERESEEQALNYFLNN